MEEIREKNRERKRYQRSQESPEFRAQRLEKVSHSQKQRISQESPECRAQRLEKLSHSQKQRISQESPECKAQRLENKSHSQKQRISQESLECRAQRLEKLSHNQQQRILEENTEDRSARLLSYCERHIEIRRGSQATTPRYCRRGLPRSTSHALTGTTLFGEFAFCIYMYLEIYTFSNHLDLYSKYRSLITTIAELFGSLIVLCDAFIIILLCVAF